VSRTRWATYECEDENYDLLYVFDVTFSGTAGTLDTWLEPGDPPEIEIETVELVSCRPWDGKEIGDKIELPEAMRKIIEKWACRHHSEQIEEKCIEASAESDHYED
jgi:hypothetical protein